MSREAKLNQNTMNRFEKLDYLIETRSPEFIKECQFLYEMVTWMSEEAFNDFFEHVCSCWGIKNPDDEEGEEMCFSA